MNHFKAINDNYGIIDEISIRTWFSHKKIILAFSKFYLKIKYLGLMF